MMECIRTPRRPPIGVSRFQAKRAYCVDGHEIGAKEDIGMPEPAHQHIVSGPRSNPLQFEQSRSRLDVIDTGVEDEFACRHCGRDPAHSVPSSSRHGEQFVGCLGKRRGGRECMGQETHSGEFRVDRRSQGCDEATGHRSGASERHLLAHDGANGCLEGVGAS